MEIEKILSEPTKILQFLLDEARIPMVSCKAYLEALRVFGYHDLASIINDLTYEEASVIMKVGHAKRVFKAALKRKETKERRSLYGGK